MANKVGSPAFLTQSLLKCSFSTSIKYQYPNSYNSRIAFHKTRHRKPRPRLFKKYNVTRREIPVTLNDSSSGAIVESEKLAPIKRGMEWLWTRPDPAPLPKYVKLGDLPWNKSGDNEPLDKTSGKSGGQLYEIVRLKPLHEHVNDMMEKDPTKLQDFIGSQKLEKLLPPLVPNELEKN